MSNTKRRLRVLALLAAWVAACAACCGAGEEARPKVVNVGKVRAHVADKRVEVDGAILLEPGILIEVLVCTPSGKTHETVMTVDCVPSNVHAALLLIGLQPGRPVAYKDKKYGPTGDRVKISARWTENGNTRIVRAEDLLYNVKHKRAMEHQYWIFCGSVMDPQRDQPYLADLTGNIVTTFNDPATVIDNPSEAGMDDDMLEINAKVCPAPGTKVTLIIEPAPKTKAQD